MTRTPPRELRRILTVWDAVALSVGVMIGSGIFAVPPAIAGRLDSFGAMISVWALGGLLALCGALTYAELSTMFPRAGGPYVFLHETYGALPAFAYGWSALFITYPASMAAVAVVFANYLARWLPLSTTSQALVAAGLCLAVAATNILGVRLGARVQRTLTAAKVAAVAAIPVFGFLLRKGSIDHLTAGGLSPSAGWSLSAWALAMAAVMWTFEGWADTPTLAGEVRDKRRDIPRALIIGTVSVTMVYLAVNAAYVYLLSVQGVATTQSVASDAARVLFGGSGEFWLVALVLVSTAGSLNGMAIGGSRVFFAMARDGLFVDRVGQVNTRFGTPAYSLALLGAVGATYALLGTFEQIIRYFVFVATIWFVLNILAVFILRRRRPAHPRPFRVPLYPVVPALFLLVLTGLGIQLLRDNTRDAAVGLCVIVSALPIYYVWRRLRRAGRRQ